MILNFSKVIALIVPKIAKDAQERMNAHNVQKDILN